MFKRPFCLCEKQIDNCEKCKTKAHEQWNIFTKQYPHDTPGQLVQRAILEDRVYLVLGIIQNAKFDINAFCEPEKFGSVSPLMVALRANNSRISALLLQHPDLDLSKSLSEYDTWSWARTSSLGILKLYLNHPLADVNQQDGNGKTILHEVVCDTNGTDKLEYLLKHKNCSVDLQQNDNTTPLYQAVLCGNIDAVELLLKCPVNINNRNYYNKWTLLHCSASNQYDSIVEKLLQNPDIDINARDNLQNTALHIAAERGHERIVKLLLRHPKIEINAKNQLGWTALSKATFSGHRNIIRQLISHSDLEVSLVDQNRQTALHWAASAGRFDMVQILVNEFKININITNRPDKQTAYDIAHALGYTEIAEFLKKKMEKFSSADELLASDDYKPRTKEHSLIKPRRHIPKLPDQS